MYARSRPAVSISGTSGTAWNAMCHTQPADDGVRRSSHPNPGTSISMTTSRRTAARYCAAYEYATAPPQSWPTRRISSYPSSVTSPWMRCATVSVSYPLRGLLESPRPGRSTAITVKCSASAGITRCHAHHVCGQPWSRTSAGPCPPTTECSVTPSIDSDSAGARTPSTTRRSWTYPVGVSIATLPPSSIAVRVRARPRPRSAH